MTLNEAFDSNRLEGKDEAAMRLYPDVTFDCALPQPWVDAMRAKGFDDAQFHFVWAYPYGHIYGHPLPVTYEGFRMLTKMGANV